MTEKIYINEVVYIDSRNCSVGSTVNDVWHTRGFSSAVFGVEQYTREVNKFINKIRKTYTSLTFEVDWRTSPVEGTCND